MKYEVEKFKSISYLIRYPVGYKKGSKYPVILFFHGAGSRGDDIEILKGNPYFTITEKHENFPFITVAPQCHEDTWFDLFCILKDFVNEIVFSEYTDSKRIYLMGASMGAYAVWQIAMSMPDVFSAIVPICGGGMYWNSKKLINLNIWAFHGEKDTVVYPQESIRMIEKINDNGGNAKLTLYKDNEHDAWTDTYSNPKIFEWLLNSIKDEVHADMKDDMRDSKIYG